MESTAPVPRRNPLIAYVAPMAVFLLLLAGVSVAKTAGDSFWLASAQYWIFPLQTLVCGTLIIWFWRNYQALATRGTWFAIAIAFGVFLLWISPQVFFARAPRLIGFNPDTFSASPSLYWATVILRFLRLVVVVPIVEEVFWRGFLLRYFIDEKFTRVPVGAFSWLSFGAVTIGFTLVHSSADWPAAFITGALYNCVAYRTKSLGSCIVAHALTNLLLGCWIMQTKQWGFW